MLAFATLFSAVTFAGEAPEALVLSKSDLNGGILAGKPDQNFDGNKARYAGTFKSADEKFSFGLFSLDVVKEETNSKRYDNFKHNEFMYFIEGRMTLTDDNGKTISASAGEILFIPKGWSGTRVTTDISKVSVIYDDAPKKE